MKKNNLSKVRKSICLVLTLAMVLLLPIDSYGAAKATDAGKKAKQKIVVIDPGHQAKANAALEQNGPGSRAKKAKVTGGASGIVTHSRESVLNLAVSKMLKKELEARGYKVYMTRTKQNVNISNKQRALMAKKYKADIFIRIHANSCNASYINGALTMCMTKDSPYNKKLYKKSYRLSKLILKKMCKSTKAKNKGLSRTNDMTGINWSKVPVTIVEMGFMSNPREDRLMNKKSYRKKIVKGIADGVDAYFK